MLGVAVGLQPQYSSRVAVPFPDGFAWDQGRFGFDVSRSGGRFETALNPRDLVNPAIWSGPALLVDRAGDDSNDGFGAEDGDFSAAKRTIHAAFEAGNATGAPYRVLVNADTYEGSAFTRNGQTEPDQPVAVLGRGGRVRYRTGPFDVNWSDAGGTYSASVSSVRRAFRTDVLTPEGLYTELENVVDVATCASTQNSWVRDGSTVHVNIGGAPGSEDIALMRSFHGARFLNHDQDIYIEGFDFEGGKRVRSFSTLLPAAISSAWIVRSATPHRPIRLLRWMRCACAGRMVWLRFLAVTRAMAQRMGGRSMMMAPQACTFCCRIVRVGTTVRSARRPSMR